MSTMTAPARLTRRAPAVRIAPTTRPLPQRPGPASRPAPPMRLTRRGRLVLTLAVAAAGVGILGVAQPQAFALGGQQSIATERVTVRPGETLWVIAERVAPGTDPRDTIARIESMNDLDSSAVPAGSVLLVPRSR